MIRAALPLALGSTWRTHALPTARGAVVKWTQGQDVGVPPDWASAPRRRSASAHSARSGTGAASQPAQALLAAVHAVSSSEAPPG